ncbi:MAG: hypothetical protein ACLR9W_04710 [Enterobacter hormaechei]
MAKNYYDITLALAGICQSAVWCNSWRIRVIATLMPCTFTQQRYRS